MNRFHYVEVYIKSYYLAETKARCEIWQRYLYLFISVVMLLYSVVT